MVYITGDIHGNPSSIAAFCRDFLPNRENDILVLLGDVGANYYLNHLDGYTKGVLAAQPITILCIHGNHEARPQNIPGYQEKTWNGGIVFFQEQYPNLLFARDGEIYVLDGLKCMAIGGAYSVDKPFRLAHGLRWFEDEQPSKEIKAYVEKQLACHHVDVILAHTCPYKYRPTDRFLRGVDQNTVDVSTEQWLDTIEERYPYKTWYCGH